MVGWELGLRGSYFPMLGEFLSWGLVMFGHIISLMQRLIQILCKFEPCLLKLLLQLHGYIPFDPLITAYCILTHRCLPGKNILRHQ